MLHDCELATLMATAGRAVEGEFRADVQAQLRLVVNAYEPHLPSLDDGGRQDWPRTRWRRRSPICRRTPQTRAEHSDRRGYPVVARPCSWCPQRRNLEVRPRVVPGFLGAITCRRRPNNDPLSTVEN